jgi:hypothetical protein
VKILGTQNVRSVPELTIGKGRARMVDNPRLLHCFDATCAATPGNCGKNSPRWAQDESEAVPAMSGSKRLRNGSKGATTGPCGYFLPGGHCWSVRQD